MSQELDEVLREIDEELSELEQYNHIDPTLILLLKFMRKIVIAIEHLKNV